MNYAAILALILRLVLALIPYACNAQYSSVTGNVTDATSGKPLSNVHVRMLPSQNIDPKIAIVYGAISKADGTFSIQGARPGAYIFEARRPGYFAMSIVPLSNTVPSNSEGTMPVQPVRISMVRQSVLSGRVLDEWGEPVQYFRVRVVPIAHARENRPQSGPGVSVTDDAGQFRIVVPPGQYRINAENAEQDSAPFPILVSTQETRGRYATTWFPSITNEADADIVTCLAGQSVGGLEIRLLRSGGIRISGRVSRFTSHSRGFVMMRAGDAAGFHQLIRPLDPEGKFTFHNVTSGQWRLFAWELVEGASNKASLPTTLEVGRSDMVGLRLDLSDLPTLHGAISTSSQGPLPSDWRVELRDIGAVLPPILFGFKKDGQFQLPAPFPAKYRLTIEGLPRNAFIDRISLDRVLCTQDILDFSLQQVSTLAIHLELNGAEVAGSIRGAFAEGSDFVSLVPINDSNAPLRDPTRTPIANGRFVFYGVRPGRYRLEWNGASLNNETPFSVQLGERLEKDILTGTLAQQ